MKTIVAFLLLMSMCMSLHARTMMWQTSRNEHTPLPLKDDSAMEDECKVRVLGEALVNLARDVRSTRDLSLLVELTCDGQEFKTWVVVDRWGKEHPVGWNLMEGWMETP